MATKANIELTDLDVVRDMLRAITEENNLDHAKDIALDTLDFLARYPAATRCLTCGEPNRRTTMLCAQCLRDAKDNDEWGG